MEIPGYTIEKQLGKGGMASVYLALHHGLHRLVAIKVMHRHIDNDDFDFSARFLREARIVANLSHQNIVTIYDVDKYDGYHYISMEYLSDSDTLGHRIKAGIDINDCLTTIKQIASALGFAHSKGIVHRDVKPENILYREDGTAVLTDFGIARAENPSTKMTVTGTIIGTPHYMSPEQGQGKDVGAFSDIYSLGIIFYEMLTGVVPYVAESSIAVLLKHITAPIPALQTEHIKYQPVLDCMLAKEPEGRYKNCMQIIADIDSVVSGGQANNAMTIQDATVLREDESTVILRSERTPTRRAVRKSSDKQSDKAKSNSKLIMAVVATLAVFAIVSGGIIYTQYNAEEERPAQQTKKEGDKQAALIEQQRSEAEARRNKELAEQEEKRIAIRKKKQQELELSLQKAREEKEKLKAQQALQKAREEEKLKAEQAAASARQARLEKQKQINTLLSTAEQQLLNTQLNKAYQTYKKVLKLDSQSKAAKRGVVKVADSYLSLANAAAVRYEFDKASNYINSAKKIDPDNSSLAATQQTVIKLKNEKLAREAVENRLAEEADRKRKLEIQAQQTSTDESIPDEPERKIRRTFGGF